jgi:hypothetical protein
MSKQIKCHKCKETKVYTAFPPRYQKAKSGFKACYTCLQKHSTKVANFSDEYEANQERLIEEFLSTKQEG